MGFTGKKYPATASVVSGHSCDQSGSYVILPYGTRDAESYVCTEIEKATTISTRALGRANVFWLMKLLDRWSSGLCKPHGLAD